MKLGRFGLNVVFDKVVHTCGGGSKVVNKYSFIKYSTLCSNGTIYSQEIGVSCWEVKLSCCCKIILSRISFCSFADLPLVVPG